MLTLACLFSAVSMKSTVAAHKRQTLVPGQEQKDNNEIIHFKLLNQHIIYPMTHHFYQIIFNFYIK